MAKKHANIHLSEKNQAVPIFRSVQCHKTLMCIAKINANEYRKNDELKKAYNQRVRNIRNLFLKEKTNYVIVITRNVAKFHPRICAISRISASHFLDKLVYLGLFCFFYSVTRRNIINGKLH